MKCCFNETLMGLSDQSSLNVLINSVVRTVTFNLQFRLTVSSSPLATRVGRLGRLYALATLETPPSKQSWNGSGNLLCAFAVSSSSLAHDQNAFLIYKV